MKYGQFCPIAKATEIIGEKWTLLIIRELLMGASRFNQMARGLGSISPALLTARLNTLVDSGLVVRRKIAREPLEISGWLALLIGVAALVLKEVGWGIGIGEALVGIAVLTLVGVWTWRRREGDG